MVNNKYWGSGDTTRGKRDKQDHEKEALIFVSIQLV